MNNFFCKSISDNAQKTIESLLSTLNERDKLIRKLSEEVETLKDIIKALENKSGYYVGLDENGLESNHIYADRIGFYDDKYVFYLNTKIVGLLSSEIYKEVVFVESENEN